MPATTVHLVVIHHGLWGSPANTEYLTTTLAKFHGGTISPSSTLTPPESTSTIAAHASTHPNAARSDLRLVVLNTEVNSGDHTYDGVDWCGERLVKDVYKEVERLEGAEASVVGKISLMGYSLGGLVIRYAVGVMFSDGFFAGGKGKLEFKSRPKPAIFTTIATPHLGVTLTGSSFSKVAAAVGRTNLGRSGRQLYLADRGWIPPSAEEQGGGEGEGLCLIEALSDPRFNFITALRLFERIDVYANAVADLTVSYRTAAFEEHDPFLLADQVRIERDPHHAALLASYEAVQGEPARKTLWSKVRGTLSTKNLPWLLNPQRFPFKFPLNYLAVVCLPALLPVMLGLVLHKLRSDSKVSDRRVEEYERMWAVEHGFLEEGDSKKLHKSRKKDAKSKVKIDQATRSGWERRRISGFLASVEAEAEETLREVGEDYVATASSASSATVSSSDNDKYATLPNSATVKLSDRFAVSPEEHPLTETQLRIVANLNDRALLPQVKKHLAHFGDVLNSHAVIIVRTVSMDMHKKGISLIKALVARFEL